MSENMAGGQKYGITTADFLARAHDTLAERAETHGQFRRTHANIALMFSAYLQLLGHPVSLKPSQAAEMLALLKVARRHEGAYNEDDDVDALGYDAIVGHLRAVEHEDAAGASEMRVRAAERRGLKPPAKRSRK